MPLSKIYVKLIPIIIVNFHHKILGIDDNIPTPRFVKRAGNFLCFLHSTLLIVDESPLPQRMSIPVRTNDK